MTGSPELMSETPPLSPSVPPPTDSASPKRPWTILGRLSQAIREQNWFAVTLEVCIVVLGVVIGFQINAWGQDRADQAREQVYLRQLVDDLRETERDLDRLDSWMAEPERVLLQFTIAFRLPGTPPRDSILLWAGRAPYISVPGPVTGTAEALVASGDIGLIQNDSLRSAITGYLERVAYRRYAIETSYESRERAEWELMRRVDNVEARMVDDPLGTDSTLRALSGYGKEDLVYRSPLDAETFMADLDAMTAVTWLAQTSVDMRSQRDRLRSDTVTLREQVEAELNR